MSGLVFAKAHARGLALFALLFCHQSASAETLHEVLARAYIASPTLNVQRAQVRAVDETVPQAQAGYRLRVQLEGKRCPQATALRGWEA